MSESPSVGKQRGLNGKLYTNAAARVANMTVTMS